LSESADAEPCEMASLGISIPLASIFEDLEPPKAA
jgi:hypothetical protein